MDSRKAMLLRKEIQERYRDNANLFTGQLTDARKVYEEEMEKLQKECPHIWDNGEQAVVALSNSSFCSICQKKFKN